MDDLNVLLIEGRLTQAPEVSVTPAGANVTSLSIASNRSYKDVASGQWIRKVSFFDVEVWGMLGELAEHRLAKGKFVRVHGLLKQDRWSTPEGLPRSRVSILASRLDWRPESAPGGEDEESEGEEEIAGPAYYAGDPESEFPTEFDEIEYEANS